MIDAAGNFVASVAIEREALSVFENSIQGLVDDSYSAMEADRLFGDREGIGDPLAMITVGLDIDGEPELVCAMPFEVRGREAVLGSYFPRSTDISIARFTVFKALEHIANGSNVVSTFARAPLEIQVPYKVSGFAESTAKDRLYLCASKLRSYAS